MELASLSNELSVLLPAPICKLIYTHFVRVRCVRIVMLDEFVSSYEVLEPKIVFLYGCIVSLKLFHKLQKREAMLIR
jgi:hypothetical protein